MGCDHRDIYIIYNICCDDRIDHTICRYTPLLIKLNRIEVKRYFMSCNVLGLPPGVFDTIKKIFVKW